MRIVTDDIFNTDADIIVHQVNCKGVMGAGIAKLIRIRYPAIYDAYRDYCSARDFDDMKLLGECLIAPATDGTLIANCFGQNSYGRSGLYTDYDALNVSIGRVFKYAASFSPKKTVAVPYGMGCGLGGGDWRIVSYLINKQAASYKVDVTAYQLKA